MIIAAGGTATALALLGACGSAGESPGVASAGGAGAAPSATATSPADRQEQLRRFAQCMRDNGVDMADPTVGGLSAGQGLPPGMTLDDPVVQAAFTACQSTLPNGGEPPKLNAEQLEAYQAFAECMREHGVDLPDPAPDGTLGLGQNPGLLSDPAFAKALSACRDTLTELRGGRS
jgi:hypothetical protein